MINYGYIIVSADCVCQPWFNECQVLRDVQHPLYVSFVVFVWHCCSMPAPIKWPYLPYRSEIQALFMVFFIDIDCHIAANVLSIEDNHRIIDSSV